VTFTPTTSGTRSAAVTITDNAAGSPQSVALAGTGSFVELAPGSLSFGNQKVSTTSAPQTITLTNTHGSPLKIATITISGQNHRDFAQTNTCGTSVAAKASCSINVTFTPGATGNRSASLSITDNGGGSPQTVGLSGTGTN
jgi:hypothetical protein